ncbi:hypothetical protein A2Z33_05470 [Candidatus Gottesmanbacteria bacterium RBG_16_52_11]|uniref:Glycosyltransferase 2-like domain-containing protein n=1 Tax=Candidatus Gottesmanbacteria bacterium RBG_16_52_11 TaxID=1798374 RepID=A0A1F5YNJ0_9BACT|nr:MAG: hypothetical protein A2Z33_05470 [Candidatus Gottesmanbacteria bacterium RBG_16_52_11]
MSVIIPAYHQERTIEADLRRILATLSRWPTGYEVILVVDGETDGTKREAARVRDRHLVITGYPTNHGKGHAVRFGMAKARGDVIGFVDAGSDLNPDSLYMMYEHFKWYNADIIIGSKRHPVSKVDYPLWRKFLSFGYQTVVRILFGLSIRDSQVGMKLFRRIVLEDVMPRLLVKEFAFDIEMLAVANHLGYRRIFEAPVELKFTGLSNITSVNFWKIIYKMLWDTAAVFYRLKLLRYYDNSNKRKWIYDPELNFQVNIG